MVVASSGLHAVAGGCCGLFVETSMQRHVCRTLIVLRIGNKCLSKNHVVLMVH